MKIKMHLPQNSVKRKNLVSNIAVSLIRYVFLIAFSYILIYPILFMIAHAFRNPIDFMDPTIEWVPKSTSFESVKAAFEVMLMPKALWNTIWIEVFASFFTIISTGVAAYGMTCFDFKLKKFLNVLLVLMILVPPSMLLIPNYINFHSFDILGVLDILGDITGYELRPNLLNTAFAVYLPAITSVGIKAGFCIFIYQQFYKGIPKELHEAAWIDGATELQTYVRVIVPSSGVAVLTVSLLSLIWHWNDYYNAQMFMSSHPTMAMRLNDFFVNSRDIAAAADAAMAACLMFVLPMLLLYMVLQKRFITSIASTGIVG